MQQKQKIRTWTSVRPGWIKGVLWTLPPISADCSPPVTPLPPNSGWLPQCRRDGRISLSRPPLVLQSCRLPLASTLSRWLGVQ